jgi:uncharacterized protein YegP (UPF0339 family)
MTGKFQLYRDAAGEFRFSLKSSIGEVVLSSEGYATRAAALNGIEAVRQHADDPVMYEKSGTADGEHRFTLTAGAHQVVGHSQDYDSASSRDKGIAAVGRAADGAPIDDQT